MGSDYTDKDIDYIKKMFCKYNCTLKVKHNDYGEYLNCKNCDIKEICTKLDIPCSKEIENTHYTCDTCQIDNFIKELHDNNII
jgi:hypothetical protein